MRWRHIIWVSPRYPATQLDKARALYPSDEATFSAPPRVLLQSPTVMTAAEAAEQESGGITEGAKPTIVIPIKGGGEKACQCHCKDKRLGARSRNLFLEAVLSISFCVLIIAVWLLPPLAPHHPTPVSVECWFLAASRKRLQIRNSHNHCRSGTALLL